VTAQVSCPPVALAPGAVVFEVTFAVAELVQPFTGFVIVTMYVPATLTVGFCCEEVKLPGPDQLYVTPLVDEFAVS
jgi:hypothetical protein